MDARRALLGLPDNATAEDIRRSYLAMAKRCHPDARGGSAEAFRALSDAYESLLQQPDPRAGGARPAGARGGSVLHHRAVFHPSRGNTLAFCGLSLLVGCGIYAGALSLHMNTVRGVLHSWGRQRLPLLSPLLDIFTHNCCLYRTCMERGGSCLQQGMRGCDWPLRLGRQGEGLVHKRRSTGWRRPPRCGKAVKARCEVS